MADHLSHGMHAGVIRCQSRDMVFVWAGCCYILGIHGVLVVMTMGCPSVAHEVHSWVTHGLPLAKCPAGLWEAITRRFFVEQRNECRKNRWLYRHRPPSFSGFSTRQVPCWSLTSII